MTEASATCWHCIRVSSGFLLCDKERKMDESGINIAAPFSATLVACIPSLSHHRLCPGFLLTAQDFIRSSAKFHYECPTLPSRMTPYKAHRPPLQSSTLSSLTTSHALRVS